ncbi:MAG: hypothetical protein N4A38_00185 [Candidatus Gracilibacteria bacterium]|nr:hypothetical protein [Candidatus Gracilibacteria bacterium]
MNNQEKKDKGIKKQAKKVDKLVTGMILGGAIASLFGVATKTKKGKKISNKIGDISKQQAKKGVSLFGKGLVKIIDLLSKKKK